MDVQVQPLLPLWKLIYLLYKRNHRQSGCTLNELKITNCRTDVKQQARFGKQFSDPECIVSYGFIGTFKASIQFLLQSSIQDSLLGLIHTKTSYKAIKQINWLESYQCVFTLINREPSENGTLYSIQCNIIQFNQHCLTVENTFLAKTKNKNTKKQKLKPFVLTGNEQIESRYNVNIMMARAYARLSNDFNPIHLSNISAKWFGQKSAIMHGMYQVHRCVSELQQKRNTFITELDVEFKKPCYLPNSLVLLKDENASNDVFCLFSEEQGLLHMKLTIKKEA